MSRNLYADNIAVVKMVRALLTEPHTVPELCELTGFHESTVRRFIRAFQYEGRECGERIIRTARWEQDRNKRWSIRAYMLGNAKDAPRPKGISNAQRCAGYKARRAHQAMIQMMAGPV